MIVDATGPGASGGRRPLARLPGSGPQHGAGRGAAPQTLGDGEELIITGEAGLDARRDLPHTRDQCGRHALSKAAGPANAHYCSQVRRMEGMRKHDACARAAAAKLQAACAATVACVTVPHAHWIIVGRARMGRACEGRACWWRALYRTAAA
jgi:hypothetical protein